MTIEFWRRCDVCDRNATTGTMDLIESIDDANGWHEILPYRMRYFCDAHARPARFYEWHTQHYVYIGRECACSLMIREAVAMHDCADDLKEFRLGESRVFPRRKR